MAIEITITQKGGSKKALPFDVIIGEHLRYGRSDGTLLFKDIIGENDFIAYNPNHIARGFNVKWKEGESHQVRLRLTIPSHDDEIDDFYDTAYRIATYWENCKIRQDNKVLSLEEDFFLQRSDAKAYSLQTLNDLCTKTKFDKNNNMVTGEVAGSTPIREGEIILHNAMWPIVLGGKEKAMLANSVDSVKFKKFLHEKQSINAYYAKAFYYEHPATKEFHAKFAIEEDTTSIFPLKPTVPWWLVDKRTGKLMEVDIWEIALFSTTKDEMLGEMLYDDFIGKLKNTEYYDQQNVLIKGVSLAEMEEMLEAGTHIVQ